MCLHSQHRLFVRLVHVFLIWFSQRTTMGVNSGHHLCRMFFSLHVVFLSVAIVESSASSADQKGERVPGRPLLSFIGAFSVKWGSGIHPITATRWHSDACVVVVRLHEIQWRGVPWGTADLLLRTDVFKLDRGHQRLRCSRPSRLTDR